MKYTKKEAEAKIDQLDEQIIKLMAQMDEIRANTIDTDKEDLEDLINKFEDSSPNVQSKFYNYIVDNHHFRLGLFL